MNELPDYREKKWFCPNCDVPLEPGYMVKGHWGYEMACFECGFNIRNATLARLKKSGKVEVLE